MKRLGALAGRGLLLAVASSSVMAVLFIFYFIARDAAPFLGNLARLKEFFTSTEWFPSREPARFGALAIIFGTGLVTAGAVFLAVPLGVSAAVCLSDVLPFKARQLVKPVIEVLAAIPSVVYGFFALVVLAPLLQDRGGPVLATVVWVVGIPLAGLAVIVLSDVAADRAGGSGRAATRILVAAVLGGLALWGLAAAGGSLWRLSIPSGANALNASLILGIMALPTVVSVSEDALTAAGRELREGSYALGATRAETIVRVVIPAARSGIFAAVILGVMRAVGETMVVWMASGNAAQVPRPWFNVLEPVRTMTATIAGDMGEAEHSTGAMRYSVLFVMGLCLLAFSFAANLVSEWIVRRSHRRLGR
jgi:phosphate transport system permease protein